MVYTLAFLFISQVQQPSLLRQVAGSPSGQNGYEEYLMAGEETRRPEFDAVWRVVNETGPGKPSWLDCRKRFARQVGAMKDFVSLGNAKPVSDPRTHVDMTTLFSEYVCFKSVAKSLPIVATVEFSQGHNLRASEMLLDGLVFSDKLSYTGSLLAYLVAIASRSIILKGYSENLHRIPLSSWATVSKECDSELRSNAFSVSVDRELDDTNREMGEILQNTEPLRDLVGEDTGEVDDTAKRLMDMPPAERSNIFQRFQADIQRYRGYCKTLANAPESTWYAALPALDQFPMSEPNRDVRALLGLTLPVVTQVFQSTLKTRTQLRLLRVHALVESYRWKTGRLPLKLTELESPIAVTDPLVSAPFKYFVKGDEYELYSDGVPPVGRIDLVYSRPKVQGGDSSDPVNP